ncbi:chromatin structure-remodeling complex protein BSH [Tanacetum coccineum]
MYKTKPHPGWGSLRNPSVKFRIPTAENLVPIRLDIDVEGQRYKDTFTWNPTDPESDVTMFAKRTVRDLKLPPTFVAPIYQSIQVNILLVASNLSGRYDWLSCDRNQKK